MQLTIAILVTMQRIDGLPRYFAQTVCPPLCTASDALLKTALQRLSNEVRKRLQSWVDRGQTHAVSAWLYDPQTDVQLFKEKLTLRDRTLSLKTILMVHPALGGSVVIAPLLDDLRFQRDPKEALTVQATRLLTKWCEQRIKDDESVDLKSLSITGDAWVEPLDIVLSMAETKKKKKKGLIGALLGQSNPGGAESLQRVGRCLDAFRSDRCKVFGRESETDRLYQLLGSSRNQGVALVGQASVGKTAILEEVVRRRSLERKNKRRHCEQVWLISPSRVISGMSYLGQWEERWLSILKEAYRRDHVLYFDDPISLYTAGITRDSQMCMADVLKSFVAEQPIRIVFEMTHEALSILRRKDRSLVDPMIPLSIDAMNESQTLETLIEVVSQIEADTQCFFHPSLLPTMIDYSATLAPQLSLPGKAITLARGLAHQATSQAIQAESVVVMNGEPDEESDAKRFVSRSMTTEDLDRFVEERTGLRLSLRQGTVSIKQLETALSKMIVGQEPAVKVLSRYAQRSLQGLQPVDRPLGVFLFMGPTGVGKTESAKALTRLLFLDESRMVRIDMNEIASASAAEGLIGTFEQPDGRLPSALRRQPNCILLLDEIEKAHPDALDYLLQVMGEGRLSDACGRAVDFRNAFIIMTSNLGSVESSQSLGYESQDSLAGEMQRETIYQRTAKRFFRPEFLNRLDEIVVFGRLERSHMRHIVDHHLGALKRRDGLSRRRMFLQVDDEATQWIIERGYDTALGARAIKRAIEREVTQPLADQLAACHIENPVWTRLRIANGSIQCDTHELRILPTRMLPPEPETEACLTIAKACVERIRQQLFERSPANPEARHRLNQVDYYSIHSALMEASDCLKELTERHKIGKETVIAPMQPSIKTTAGRISHSRNHRAISPEEITREERKSDLDLREGIMESGARASIRSDPTSPNRKLMRLLAIADMMLKRIDEPSRWLVRVRFLNPPGEHSITGIEKKSRSQMLLSLNAFPVQLTAWLGDLLQGLQYTVHFQEGRAVAIVEGASVGGLLMQLQGTYQVAGDYGMERLLLIEAKTIDDGIQLEDRSACDQEAGRFTNQADGFPNSEYCGRDGWTIIRGQIDDWIQDFRTGRRIPLKFSHEWQAWLLDQLPLPEEFT